MVPALLISWGREVAGSRWWNRDPNEASCNAPKRSVCATMQRRGSTATTSRRARRFRSQCIVPKGRSDMTAHAGNATRSNYLVQLGSVVATSLALLVRSPSHSRRADAARRMSLHWLTLLTIGALVIMTFMFVLDEREIGLMPPRGTAALWPLRILTDTG